MGRDKDLPIPPTTSPAALANEFNEFFIDKIHTIKKKILSNNIEDINPHFMDTKTDKLMTEFRKVSGSEIWHIIMDSPGKCCESDPIPTSLLKKILPSIIDLITDIVNKSMLGGQFPEEFKEALVKPLLKKINLELIKKNYRPVSNLAFLGKVIERCAAKQIIQHIENNGLMEPHQLAYRKHHSTETCLLKIKSDILEAMDRQMVTCVLLLDASTAFDTISHKVLLERLSNMFGLRESVLSWIKSYITGRKQKVVIGDHSSEWITLHQGVPQGSVLGPIVFTLYTCPLGKISRDNNTDAEFFADDEQIYVSFKPSQKGSQEDSISRLENCVTKTRTWMNANHLKLNDEKTEFVILGTNQQLSKLKDISVRVRNETINPVETVCDLGYYLDKNLNNGPHINKVTRNCFHTLRNIQKLRSHLDQDTTHIIVQALVISKLDYCNSFLLGSAQYQLDKLQHIQNMACRVVTNLRKYDHITVSMRNLHWLRIRDRIIFKVALLMYKAGCGNLPQYLSELLTKH